MKDINNYEGKYSATEEGFVYSHFNKRLLMGAKNIRNGYMQVYLFKNGKGEYFYVHRIIAETFIPNPDNKPEVDHINGDRTDNRVENLRWTTKKENRNNPITINRMSKAKCGRPAHNKQMIVQMDTNNNVICIYESETAAALATSTRRTDISAVVNGRQKTANGFKWKYYDN